MKRITLLTIAFLICSCSSTPKEEPFTVDLKSPRYAAGSAEAYFEKYLGIGSLNHGDIEVSYYPLEDAACLNFKALQFVNCHQFWSKDARDAFVTALERYKEDYGQRKLAKGRKTRETYGSVPGYFAWKKTPVSKQAYGGSKIKLGYQIKNKAAFFTATQMEAYFEDPISQRRDQTSAVTTLYFTRAQAESLAELFKQEYLQTLGRPASTVEEVDEY